MKKDINVLFTGDIYIPEHRPKVGLSKKLEQLFADHALISCNFEGSVFSPQATPINKAGPHLYQSQEAIDFITQLKIQVINLANNHIYDYGEKGLEHTLEILKKNIVVGAGLDFESAYELKVTTIKKTKLGFLSFCEAEFGAYLNTNTRQKGGFAWVNHASVNKRIQQAKQQVDVLFIQVHAGIEEIDVPLPEWRERYRELITWGADTVIGHHPHVPQGWEEYQGKTIFYSLGNFCFDVDNPCLWWDKGLVVSFLISKNKISHYRVTPIEKKGQYLDLATTPSYLLHLKTINKVLSQSMYLKVVDEYSATLWQSRYLPYYKKALGSHPPSWFYQLMMKLKGKPLPRLVDYSLLLHLLQIESHRWCVQRALTQKSYQALL